ncbi:hypothetical protein H5410_004548 [Solanum commersonii]|uniref:Uncharacterized protein n=1 Tax=Solanum commersonii TaxID=4109 RepID=A0A9J6B8Q4_SOLCO|nr:hypothetical protein H5410_004548 [Solanum commersonii]
MVLQVVRVVTRAPIPPLLIQNQNLFANRPNQLVENTNIDREIMIEVDSLIVWNHKGRIGLIFITKN